MKTNFKKNKVSNTLNKPTHTEKKELTQKEFEDFIVKSGAKGSFMVYRSTNKDEELGLDLL